MPYIDTNTRSTTPLSNEMQRPLGRMPLLTGVFVGWIKDASDVQRNGRLRVWIPELGSAPDEEQSWMVVSYCSPFAGATNVDTISKANLQTFEGTQTSYGMWMIPPDINNQVLVMFANGDAARGFWIGCLYNQFTNNMIPGMAADSKTWQYPGKLVPAAEYNKWDTKVTQPDRAFKPYEATKFKGIGNQGLITDQGRGVTSTSARRESPSRVFGIITPGPVIDDNVSPANIRRKGGSSFIMDDETGSEYVQLTTKTGAQIRIDETNGFVYLINRDGTAWVQMDKDGNVDIFGARDISMRAQRDLNIRADRNVNIEAGQNIFIKAAKDTTEGTTTFTYDVNNLPQKKTIPVWNYKGEGNGQGGNIVMQALNNWQSTTQKGAFLTVIENDMNINIGNSLQVTTQNGGQNFNSKQGVMVTTDATVDIAATGNIRVGSNGLISVVGSEGVIICSNADMSLKAAGTIDIVAGSDILAMSTHFGITSDTQISGMLDVTGNLSLSGSLGGGSGGSSSATFLGSLNVDGDLNVNGISSFNVANSNSGNHINPPNVIPPIPPTPATEPNPPAAEAAMSAPAARPAEVKPNNDKINILATWLDPDSKFKRKSESLQTTVSRFPTYEPCPEHENFNTAKVSGYKPIITEADKTYEGSSGVGNNATTAPPTSTVPGSNNTSVQGDPPTDNSVSKDININALRCQLINHEGLVKKVYLDTTNLLHGGIGHLLRSNEVTMYPLNSPLSDEQIETWFSQDSTSAIKIAQELLGDTWGNLSDIRKRAVVDLSYNLGKARLAKFTAFLAAVKVGDFNAAGKELRNSAWFTQVGRRGPNIQTMIVQDVDPTRCNVKFPE